MKRQKFAKSILVVSFLLVDLLCQSPSSVGGEFQAASAIIDVTPEKLPAIINGGILTRSIATIKTRLHARAVAVSDEKQTAVIIVVDSCMLPKPLIDEVKSEAVDQYQIEHDHILISATHCHSAPSCMGALGTDEDPNYIPQLKRQLVTLIGTVLSRLAPAEVGFSKTNAPEFTALRRWIRRPDRIANDPFGNPTVRANMHAAANWDDVTGPSGPEDPELSLIAIRTIDGKPLGVLANFSMHYFGDSDISADYFGLFCSELCTLIEADSNCVAIMSHGCSGDIWKRDYSLPADQRNDAQTIEEYSRNLAKRAFAAYGQVQFTRDAPIEMLETRLSLRYRTPDLQRLEWAKNIVASMGGRSPETITEVYAREQILLEKLQKTEIVLQAMTLGDIAITTTPNETYAISGLKIKAASPFKKTMVIELANGGDGYIPPPEQHHLGGYNTWAARSAGLEIDAEPKIVEGVTGLLEKLAGTPRKQYRPTAGPAASLIETWGPALWWELDEFQGPRAIDRSGHNRDGFYEAGITYFLEGPANTHQDEAGPLDINRAAMFAGGRVQGNLNVPLDEFTVSLWCWNGMPPNAREITGWLFSAGKSHGISPYSFHLGVAGGSENSGRLVLFYGDSKAPLGVGLESVQRWTWHHIALVKSHDLLHVYLDGKMEIATDQVPDYPKLLGEFFLGGSTSGASNWEGRIDQLTIFPRALNSTEIESLRQR